MIFVGDDWRRTITTFTADGRTGERLARPGGLRGWRGSAACMSCWPIMPKIPARS